MALESLQDDLGSALEEHPNSLLLQLLPKLLGSDLAPIVFGGFLKRAAVLLSKQLLSQEDAESGDLTKKLQYTAFILWALFSPASVKEYAKSLHEKPAFIRSALQLNCSLLKASCELKVYTDKMISRRLHVGRRYHASTHMQCSKVVKFSLSIAK